MADDVKDAIEKNAKGPRRAKGDVGEVQQHSCRFKRHRRLLIADAYAVLFLTHASLS